LCRLWAPRGSRPRIWRQTQYDYLYVFGALCPHTGQTSGLIAPSIHAITVNAFLEQFSRELSPDVHAVLIWDQAGFHTARDIHVPANITIIPLPPYSPQLNPVERLWQYLRQHYWSNRVYANYDALRLAAIDAWHRTCLDPKSIKSICKTKYIESALI
jgi:transposase